jgi:hypothetical protein
MQNLSYVGKVRTVKQIERKNKETKGVDYYTEMTVEFQQEDEKGDDHIETTNFTFPVTALEELKTKKNKFIIVPITNINTAKGTFVFQNDNLPTLYFDKHPFEYAIKAK